MELSLRKARKLEAKIENMLATLRPQTTTSLRVKGEIDRANLAQQEEAFRNNIAIVDSLNSARFQIRGLIAEANMNCGVVTLMNNRECLISRKNLLERINQTIDPVDMTLLQDELEAKKVSLQKGDSYNVTTTLRTSFVGKDTKQSVIDSIKEVSLALEALEEELIQKNSGVKVKLNTELVTLLKNNSLV